ncbi:MAG: AzlC family ABC transporter permease [Lachnospiraceae bacterium]|nr:AzlC family ABC transporter permease [Lachnospiraceae bacterium]
MKTLNNNQEVILEGLKAGFPIGLGYFAVSFSLGIIAKSANVSPLQCFITSFLNHASAGEYAIFTCIRDNVSYLEIALMVLIANIRYVLMSCALSQRVHEKESMFARFIFGFTVTDEIFAVEIGRKGYLQLAYTVTAFMTAVVMWSCGTTVGCLAGNILPGRIVSALSVALYGMFLAIIIPPARKDKLIGGIIAICFAMSYLAARLPVVKNISSGTRIIVLTVIIASVCAILFPVKEDDVASESDVNQEEK